MPYLIARTGTLKGKIYKVGDKNIVIGRDPKSDIYIADPSISRENTEIFKIGEIYYIRDLESTNGTFLNKEKIKEEMLKDGDEIIIGTAVFSFREKLPEEEEIEKKTGIIYHEEDETTLKPEITIDIKKIDTTKYDLIEQRIFSKITNFTCRISNISRTETDLGILVEKIITEVIETINAAQGYYFFIDKTGEIKPGVVIDKYGGERKVSKTILKAVVREQAPMLIKDATLDERFSLSESVVYKGIRSVICLPVVVQGKIAGIIYLHNRPHLSFKREDFEIATIASLHIGNAILASKILDQTKKGLTSMVTSLVTSLEIIDPKTQGHASRVADYSVAIASEISLSDREVNNIKFASLLHDIGKLTVFKEHGKVFDEAIKEQHVYAGEKIVSAIEGGADLLPGIKYHHERANGTGFPYKIKNEQTPLMAKIIIVTNAFDHLLSWKGVAEAGLSLKDALRSIAESSEKGEFDKDVVKTLLVCYRKGILFAHHK
jgi:HD-GYP domain-containing protein (c-di-GMP phosphodiesterase class II)